MGCAQSSSTCAATGQQAAIDRHSPTLLTQPVGKLFGRPSGKFTHSVGKLHESAASGRSQALRAGLDLRDDGFKKVDTHKDRQVSSPVCVSSPTQRTSLHLAASNGDAAVALALLRDGASVDSKNDHGDTALLCAATYGHVTVVQLLLAAGAEVDALDGQEMTPLHWAARMSHVDLASVLLDAGASLDSKSCYGYTPFAMAQDWGSGPTRTLFEERGGWR